MSKERADFGLEIPDFQPRTKPPVDKAEVREAAERTGFTARHAPAPAAPVVPAQAFDARSCAGLPRQPSSTLRSRKRCDIASGRWPRASVRQTGKRH